MTVYKIPLTPKPQNFDITLGQTLYAVTMRWNTFANCWVLDFADDTGVGILSGVPMITGADLLEQYGYLDFGGSLYAQNDANPQQVPSYTDLGADSNVYFVTSP